MARATLIQEIGEWLIDQALSEPDIIELFGEVCCRLHSVGVPVARARLTWPTLHPLFQAETVLWKRGQDTEFEQFNHQDDASEEWLRSPMAYMFEHGVSTLRRNLDGPNKLVDFPILDDLIEQGLTDYLVIATSFAGAQRISDENRSGIFLTWACDREGGFTDDDLEALNKIQRRFATAVKTAVQRRIAVNITETYLGRHAGAQVLDGAIRLGDGRETQAVVWYADMRNSTSLAETMAPAEFLELLNEYFKCSAGPAIDFGGEVLDFIGDAVLAIFPFEDEEGKAQAVKCATMAMARSMELLEEARAERIAAGKVPFDFGLSLNAGPLTFGNIGVASRLAFSVIGPTVNEAERIETLTKLVEAKALATRDVAEFDPDRWVSIGEHQLEGVAQKCELFALRETDAVAEVVGLKPEARVAVN